MVQGNYYEGEATLLGALGQVALGFTGVDILADIRDLIYDVTQWENTPEHIAQTALDVLSLLPGVGAAKYGDETFAVIKKFLGPEKAGAGGGGQKNIY